MNPRNSTVIRYAYQLTQLFLSSFAEILSYVNVLTCAVRAQPWDCVYERSGRMFDSIQDALKRKEDALKGKVAPAALK